MPITKLGGDAGPIRLLWRRSGDSNLLIIHEHLPAFRNITFPNYMQIFTHFSFLH